MALEIHTLWKVKHLLLFEISPEHKEEISSMYDGEIPFKLPFLWLWDDPGRYWQIWQQNCIMNARGNNLHARFCCRKVRISESIEKWDPIECRCQNLYFIAIIFYTRKLRRFFIMCSSLEFTITTLRIYLKWLKVFHLANPSEMLQRKISLLKIKKNRLWTRWVGMWHVCMSLCIYSECNAL